MFEPLVYHDFQ